MNVGLDTGRGDNTSVCCISLKNLNFIILSYIDSMTAFLYRHDEKELKVNRTGFSTAFITIL